MQSKREHTIVNEKCICVGDVFTTPDGLNPITVHNIELVFADGAYKPHLLCRVVRTGKRVREVNYALPYFIKSLAASNRQKRAKA